MAPMQKKGRARTEDDSRRPKKKLKIRRKQSDYHSSSEDEEDGNAVAEASAAPKSILKQRAAPTKESEQLHESDLEGGIDVDELEKNTALNAAQEVPSEDDANDLAAAPEDGNSVASQSDEDDSGDSDSEAASSTNASTSKARKKRNDPSAFATSISKILSTKLTTSKRPDPVLSRSKDAASTHKAIADAKLDQKARAQLRLEKKQALQKGRVTDVLGLETPDVDTGKIQEEEKRFKKTAQRGVVKLFNAVRAAQVRAEDASRQAREEGVVGRMEKEERVNEMSKEGFLELISQGGKGAIAA